MLNPDMDVYLNIQIMPSCMMLMMVMHFNYTVSFLAKNPNLSMVFKCLKGIILKENSTLPHVYTILYHQSFDESCNLLAASTFRQPASSASLTSVCDFLCFPQSFLINLRDRV